jgi:hypothetical protein
MHGFLLSPPYLCPLSRRHNAKQVEGIASAINFRITEAEFSEINTFLDANL